MKIIDADRYLMKYFYIFGLKKKMRIFNVKTICLENWRFFGKICAFILGDKLSGF